MPTSARNRHHHAGENAETASESFDALFQEDADPAEFFDEDQDDDWESAFPEEMESDPDWMEIHSAGFDHIDVARAAFPEIADADEAEVEDFLFEITEGMSDAEFKKFFKGLAKFGKKALSVAAPVIQAAAPMVGTAVGAAFGGVGAPIGGAIGDLLGSGVGALNQAVNAPSGGRGRARPPRKPRSARRRPSRGRRMQRRQMRRPRRRTHTRRRRGGGGVAQFGRMAGQVGVAAGGQVMQLLQNPQIQNALLSMAQRGVGAITGTGGETISGPAAIAGLIGGMEMVLLEAQEAGHDLDSFDGDFAPEDFGSAREAFETLVELIGDA